jgi:polyisoprenoid-binding protein YceI
MSLRTWTLDPTHSSVDFTIRHMVVANVRGRFTRWTADLQLDDADLTRSSLAVSVDTPSIDTNNQDRDAHLRAPDFFDVATFPTMTFRSTRIERAGQDRYRVTGELTIRDVTREVVLEAELNGTIKGMEGEQRRGFSARTSIDRRQFGLTWNMLLEAGGVVVGESVDIAIELAATAAAAAAGAAA